MPTARRRAFPIATAGRGKDGRGGDAASDGAALAELHKDRPGFFSVADRMIRVWLVPGLGSVLIKRDGTVVGAVGVSGAKPEQDLECAEAGLASFS